MKRRGKNTKQKERAFLKSVLLKALESQVWSEHGWRVEGPYAPRYWRWQDILAHGSALRQQPEPRENEFQPHIPAVLRRNFSLFPLPRAHTSLAGLPPSSFLRAPTYGVDGMECLSHWPERHSLRWYCLPDWLATPDPPPTPPLGLPGSPPPSAAPSLRPRWLPPRSQPRSTWLARGPGPRAGPAPRARGSINTAARRAGRERGGGAVVSQSREWGNLGRGGARRRLGYTRSSERSDWGPGLGTR